MRLPNKLHFDFETLGKEFKFELDVEGVDLDTFKNAYHGRVKLGRKIGDVTVVDIKYMVQEPGFLNFLCFSLFSSLISLLI